MTTKQTAQAALKAAGYKPSGWDKSGYATAGYILRAAFKSQGYTDKQIVIAGEGYTDEELVNALVAAGFTHTGNWGAYQLLTLNEGAAA